MPTRRRFAQEPTFLKIAVAVTFYNAFVFFEELVVDRYGLWRYLPLYKVGKLCLWDLGALLAILWFSAVGLARKLKSDEQTSADHPTSVKLLVGLMFVNAFVLAVAILDRYELLEHVPAAALLILMLALLASVGWWLLRRPHQRASFADQPMATKLAAGLAVYNSIVFIQYFV